MNFIELTLIAVGLSMDTFAVAICIGLTMVKASLKKALIVGLYFGIFQGGMPLIGYFAALLFTDSVIAYNHWIAFGLLSFLGGKMIIGGFKKENPDNEEALLNVSKMLTLAIATSIDAMAVGVTFAFLEVDIIPAVLLIGITTLIISMLGVKIGNKFGSKFKSKAEIIGGLVLLFMGVRILIEHLEIL